MNDLISRQAAIDAIEKYFGDLPVVVHHDMLQIIKKLPAADVPDSKVGKWMLQTYRLNTGDHDEIAFYICSECGSANWIKEDKYCRNCGAKMEDCNADMRKEKR